MIECIVIYIDRQQLTVSSSRGEVTDFHVLGIWSQRSKKTRFTELAETPRVEKVITRPHFCGLCCGCAH